MQLTQSKYLNVYVYGEKRRLPNLIDSISKALKEGWTSNVHERSTRSGSDDEIQEYRFTSNETTGFLRFFCSVNQPYVFYLRDSGIVGADSPITLQDNDYLVWHFVTNVLKPVCADLDLKLQVTRTVKH
jgi:hypothetical protein